MDGAPHEPVSGSHEPIWSGPEVLGSGPESNRHTGGLQALDVLVLGWCSSQSVEPVQVTQEHLNTFCKDSATRIPKE